MSKPVTLALVNHIDGYLRALALLQDAKNRAPGQSPDMDTFVSKVTTDIVEACSGIRVHGEAIHDFALAEKFGDETASLAKLGINPEDHDRLGEAIYSLGNFRKKLDLWRTEDSSAATGGTAGQADTVDDDSRLAPSELAALFGVPLGPLQSRLNRWRSRAFGGYIEDPNHKPREPKYLYRVGSIRPIIEKLKATSERPAK